MERTEFGNPFTGITKKRTVDRVKAVSAFQGMAQLAGRGAKMVLDAQEDQAVMDAQNDIINDSINPDKEIHQAAYAWTVADSEALGLYNSMKTQTEQGAFDDIDPEDFQKLIKEGHQEYYKKWENNPHGSQAIKSYNTFMIKHGGTITAAQAGKWRVKQGENQGNALKIRVSEMSRGGVTDIEAYMNEIESAKYSLVDPNSRARIVLEGASVIAKDTGSTELLELLDKEFGYSSDKVASTQYNKAMYDAQLKNRHNYEQQRAVLYDDLLTLREEGVLLPDMYDEYIKDALPDAAGKPLMNGKEWVNFLNTGLRNREKGLSQNIITKKVQDGVPVFGATKEQLQKGFNEVRSKAELIPDTTSEDVAYTVGEALRRQPGIDSVMQDKATVWSQQDPIIDSVVNPVFISMYHDLKSLQRGIDNDSTFFKHLDDEAKVAFMYLENAQGGLPGGLDARMEQALVRFQKHKDLKESGKLINIIQNPAEITNVIDTEIASKYSFWEQQDLVPWDTRQDDGRLLEIKQRVGAYALQLQRDGNMTTETARDQIKVFIDDNYVVINKLLQHTKGIRPEIVVGDSNPGKVVTNFIDGALADSVKNFEGSESIVWNFDRGVVEIGDSAYPDRTTIDIPFDILHRTNWAEKNRVKFYGSDLSNTDVMRLYRGQNVALPGEDVSTLKARPEINGNKLAVWINEQSVMNTEFYNAFISKDVFNLVDADLNLPTDTLWSGMSQEQKTITRSNYMGKMAGDLETITNFSVNYANFKNKQVAALQGAKGFSFKEPDVPTAADIENELTPRSIIPENIQPLQEFITGSEQEGTSAERAKSAGYESEYDITLGFGAYDPAHKSSKTNPVSEMTLNELIQFQGGMLSNPKNKFNSSAVGKYQIVRKTLKGLIKIMDLKGTEVFTPELQDQMFLQLLKGRGLNNYIRGDKSKAAMIKSLESEWESLGKTTKEWHSLLDNIKGI